jgi:hypothetical protein
MIRILLALSVSLAQGTPARIVIYAPTQSDAQRWTAIECDGARLAEIRRGFLFVVELPPGRHACAARDGVPFLFETVPGELVHLRLDWKHHVGRAPVPVLAKAAQGPREVRLLSYLPKKRPRHRAVLTDDPRDPSGDTLRPRHTER